MYNSIGHVIGLIARPIVLFAWLMKCLWIIDEFRGTRDSKFARDLVWNWIWDLGFSACIGFDIGLGMVSA